MFSESSDSGSMPVSKIIEFKVQGSNILLIVTMQSKAEPWEFGGWTPPQKKINILQTHIWYYLANQGTP